MIFINNSKLKYLSYILIILNILDALTTSYFVSKLGVIAEGNLLLLYLFERYNYNFILFMKVVIFSIVILYVYKMNKNANLLERRFYFIGLTFITILLTSVVFINIYVIIFVL